MKTAPDTAVCSGRLTAFNPEAHWTESSPEAGHDYFIAPVATFRLLTPVSHADREIVVRFRSEASGSDAIVSSMANQTGSVYRLALPADYLEGNYVSINYENVDNMKKVEP